MIVWEFIFNFFSNLGTLISGWLYSVLPDWAAYLIMGIINVIVVILILVGAVIFIGWVERRTLGKFQIRLGPNRAGPQGILQIIADVIKLFLKEDIVPRLGDKWVHLLAPIVVFIPTLLAVAVLPLEQGAIFADLNVGILYIVAVTTLTGVGVFMAGWGSSNKYSGLAAMRAVAQMVSYEIPLVLSIIGVVMLAGSLSMTTIVEEQTVPFILLQPLGFLIYFIGASAEVNRSPADLLEAESELVTGFNMEYSSMKWGLFLLGEYGAAVVVSAIITTLFLSGWKGPLLPPWLWFIVKTLFVYFVLIWVRSTIPRLRVDQLMGFAWKFLFPLALANIFITAIELLFWPDVPWPLLFLNIALAILLLIVWSKVFRLGASGFGVWGYGLGIAKGMAVTIMHLFRRPITVSYPEQKLDIAERHRGYEFAWDAERCTACNLCVNACPHQVIRLEIEVDENKKRRVKDLEIDLGRCMFCGLCIEACNRRALSLGVGYETATYRRGDLIAGKERLAAGVAKLSAYARPRRAAEAPEEEEES